MLVAEGQPLLRPDRVYQVCSKGFLFDETVVGCVLKALPIGDDASHDCCGTGGISDHGVVRMLERLAIQRGLPKVIRTDSGKKFCGKAMIEWAHARSVALRLIEPSKLNQNAYVESFDGRLRDECLNTDSPAPLHALSVIKPHHEYKYGRSEKALDERTSEPTLQNADDLGYPKPRTRNGRLLKGGASTHHHIAGV